MVEQQNGGYSGFEIGSNFVSHGIKSDEITKDMDIKICWDKK